MSQIKSIVKRARPIRPTMQAVGRAHKPVLTRSGILGVMEKTKDVPDNCVVGGVPAKKIKDIESDV